MPAVAAHSLKQVSLLAPVVISAVAAHRYKDVFFDKNPRSNVVCESNLAPFPRLSLSNSCGSIQPLHAFFSQEKKLSQLSAASTSFFRDQTGVLHGIPRLPARKKSLEVPKAYKNDFFNLPLPVLAEKPEWWMRTLASLAYLFAIYISDTGNFILPFLERYDFFGLVFYVPGAVSRLPSYFPMIYYYIGLVCIVKNKEFPHFLRYHVMMGMLLETALQVIWYTSNFFPIINFNGLLGMYYWAGIGFAYILILLQCIRCALAGGYAHIPFISDAALVHTMFNIGGFQRPF